MTVTEHQPLVYDPFSWEIQHNPYPTYERLREEAPVFHNETHGFWALSRHADVLAASLAPLTFVSSHGVTLEGMEQGQPLLILKDPPEHEWHRKVVSRVFTPKYVSGLEPYIRQVACELLDGLRGRDTFDVIEEFSVQLPLRVAAELLGIPEDRRMPIHEASDRIVARNEDGTPTDDAVTAQIELGVLMYEMVVEHKRNPVDGVFDLLVNSPVVDGDGSEHFLTEEELATRFLELAFAGHETVARLIPNGIVALAWTPDARHRLVADPALIPTAVEEMLRWDAPSHYQGRWSTEATEWHGVTIPADQRVILVTGAANHDPRVYAHPERFDLDRQNARPLSFGFGVHLCLGANLARMETKVAFEELLARFPDWELDEPGIVRLRSGNVRGLGALPIRPLHA